MSISCVWSRQNASTIMYSNVTQYMDEYFDFL